MPFEKKNIGKLDSILCPQSKQGTYNVAPVKRPFEFLILLQTDKSTSNKLSALIFEEFILNLEKKK